MNSNSLAMLDPQYLLLVEENKTKIFLVYFGAGVRFLLITDTYFGSGEFNFRHLIPFIDLYRMDRLMFLII